MPDGIVAYECVEEGIAIEANALDDSGNRIGPIVLTSCPLCGGKVRPIGQAEWDANYADEEFEGYE